ncbi:MAG: YicC family protein [Dysgonamonadaceae bacterium]|jgi:uncharacterized protein (TIGR00255 family)|nr:YicC family protein [Dysgonamonadaceae bacterium]
MIQSMTGFGKAEKEFCGKKVTVEIKSLNSKQMDINARIPAIYRDKEMDMRNLLFQRIERGKVDFTLTVDFYGKTSPNRINTTLAESYFNDLKEISEKLGIEPPADWFASLVQLPDIVKTDVKDTDEEEWKFLKQTVLQAIEALVAFRTQEGEMLEKLFVEKIAAIKALSLEIEKYEDERIDKIKSHLQENLGLLDVNYDKNRYEQELIYYIDRLDINEEKNRLANHLKYFLETMKLEKSQGRKLGFIVQEIGREVNTLGSKSNHAEMQKVVVRMKDELEQIKEQILNVL